MTITQLLTLAAVAAAMLSAVLTWAIRPALLLHVLARPKCEIIVAFQLRGGPA